MTPPEALPADLRRVLESARALGLVGPASLEAQVRHARAFLGVAGPLVDGPVLDLGSGGGLPGLVVAAGLPDRRIVLLDAAARRCRHLSSAVGVLGVGSHVEVVHARAELAARDPRHRGHYALVVSRSFGSPAATAECARGFLRPGGRLVVSDPPEGDATRRWPEQGLAELGLAVVASVLVDGGGAGGTGGGAGGTGGAEGAGSGVVGHFTVLEAVGACPPDVPRSDGRPAKRPRF